MFTKRGLFTRNPRLMFITEPADGGGGGTIPPVIEPKFPADTPVKEMTPEQQAAFHENKARRLEDRLKGFNGLTPEQVAKLQEDLDAARVAGQSAEEKALADATEAGRAEVRAVLANERVTVALEKATQGRVIDPAAAFALDKAQFIDGDKANAEKITAWVEAHSTAADAAPKPFPNLFQGDREQSKTTDRETGRAEAQKRFGTKS